MKTFSTPFPDVANAIIESGGSTLDHCFQCGTCSGTCPWNLFTEFRVRNVLALAQLGLEGYEGEDLWMCATCNACVDRCPRGVEIVDLIRVLRTFVTQSGTNPATLRTVLSSAAANGNPWSGKPEERYAWLEGVPHKIFNETSEFAYFPCCMQSYDARNTRAGKAVIALLERLGVRYGLLGEGEQCCGDAVRKAGGEDIFPSLAQNNAGLFRSRGVKKIYVTSPHCLNSFKKEYPDFGSEVEPIHIVELIRERISEGALKPDKPVPLKAIYHDPCYLGRHNGVYDAPREVLSAIPGLDLMEFDRNKEDAMCCGGGGGRLWLETPVEERFSVFKMKEAIAKGAQALVTACPYCLSMFEDAKTALNNEDFLVLDINEIVLMACKENGR